MLITETKIKVSDLCQNYKDDGDGGIFGHYIVGYRFVCSNAFYIEMRCKL